jgi:hypothetical protein
MNLLGAAEMWIATFSDPDDNYFQLMSPMWRRPRRTASSW